MENTNLPNEIQQRLIQELRVTVEPLQVQAIVDAIGILGYQIVLPEQNQQSVNSQKTSPKIPTIGNSVSELLQLWQSRNPTNAEWCQPQSYALLAKRFIDLGVPYSAREVAEAGLPHASGQVRLGLRATNPDKRSQHLRASLALYEAAWKAADGSYWTGINVASLHLLLGDHAQAAAIAKQIETDLSARAMPSLRWLRKKASPNSGASL